MFNKILHLTGTWQLERDIKNFGQASGQASFSEKDKNLIFYREDLMLINGTKSFREYYYSFNSATKETFQLFNDKRIFAILDFNEKSQIATGEHLCGKDYYYIKYSLIEENKFTTEYKIIGPHKNETIVTEYIRLK